MRQTSLTRRTPLHADPEKARQWRARSKPLTRKPLTRKPRQRRQSGTSKPTPQQRHREAVMERARQRHERGERVECGLAFLGGECSGRPEADHVIPQAEIVKHFDAAWYRRLFPADQQPGDAALTATSLDDLLADARNSWPSLVCQQHHWLRHGPRRGTIRREHIPQSVEAFARDFGLLRVLDREFPADV